MQPMHRYISCHCKPFTEWSLQTIKGQSCHNPFRVSQESKLLQPIRRLNVCLFDYSEIILSSRKDLAWRTNPALCQYSPFCSHASLPGSYENCQICKSCELLCNLLFNNI